VEASVVGIGHTYAIHAVEVREEGVGVAGEMAVVVGEDFAEEFGFGVGECFDHVSSVVAVKEELTTPGITGKFVKIKLSANRMQKGLLLHAEQGSYSGKH